jgi:hypothetical protein
MEENEEMRTMLHLGSLFAALPCKPGRDEQRIREGRRHSEEGKAAFALKRPSLIRLIVQAVAARRQRDAWGELM